MNRIRSIAWAGIVSILTVSLVTVASQAQPKAQQGTVQVGTQGSIMQTPWFSNPDVRQQFKFSDETFNRLNSSYKDAWGRYQKGLAQLDKDLTDEQRRQRMRDLELNFYKDFSTTTDSVITDADQRQRYNQLYWQYRGFGAFDDPMIVEKLKLTPEQREKFTGFSQDWSRQLNELGPIFQTNREDANRRFTKLQSEMNTRLDSVLTPEQQKSWRVMIGEPYAFQPSVYFQTNGTTPKNNK